MMKQERRIIMRKVMYCLTSVIVAVMLIGFSIGVVQARPCELPFFDVNNFDYPQDNIYFPMAFGDVYVYEAETEDGLMRNYIYISYDIVPILDVDCTVVYDVEWLWVEEEGMTPQWFKLEETEDWHAWDKDGNFWYFGEWTTEYEYDDNWNLTGSNNDGSWTAGVAGALPGIVMPANPMQGDCYYQEYYEGEAEDMAKVLRLNATISIELGDYEDCLVTKEWTKLEPGNVEHKYYAPDLGLVYIEELKEKTVKVELVDIDAPPLPDPPDPLP
jgi:hypothetical protein